jgi:hypothetical protein
MRGPGNALANISLKSPPEKSWDSETLFNEIPNPFEAP